jgi:hypothetical protein
MKIQTVIKHEETIDKEVQLPYYFSLPKNDKFFKVNEDETVICVLNSHCKSITFYPSTSVWLSEIAQGQEIAPGLFHAAYHDVLLATGVYVPAPEPMEEEAINTEAVNQ